MYCRLVKVGCRQRLAGVPATSARLARLVHQSKYWNASEKLRSQRRCSTSQTAAQSFHQHLSGQDQELVTFVRPFPGGAARFPRPLEDCARLFPNDRRNRKSSVAEKW